MRPRATAAKKCHFGWLNTSERQVFNQCSTSVQPCNHWVVEHLQKVVFSQPWVVEHLPQK
jgi:hypothetical protein